MNMTPKEYMKYIKMSADKIAENREYVTELDAATGDGDHWVNMNQGFREVLKRERELSGSDSMKECLKQVGMIMMSAVGGSSGALYGSAYITAAKSVKETLDERGVCEMLDVMCKAMMARGNAEPGFKTMIDAIYPAVACYEKGIADGKDYITIWNEVKEAARLGAESTKNMKAVKGRASYQPGKGVGHIDAGAVTMAYQLECLMECLIQMEGK